MTPEKMPPACPTMEPPTMELVWAAASQATVFTAVCRPWVTAASAASAFIEDGFVFVSASWVFSSGNSFWLDPCSTYTLGMWLFETGGSGGGVAADLDTAAADSFPEGEFEPAIIALSSFSVTPALCKRTSSAVEVLYLPGCVWISRTTTDSGKPLFTIVITSSLV